MLAAGAIGVVIQKTGKTLDELVAAKIISKSDADAYLAGKVPTSPTDLKASVSPSGDKLSLDKGAAANPENPLLADAMTRNGDRLVVNQGNIPTCGHNSCAMVGDTLGVPVDLYALVKNFPPSKDGIVIDTVASALKASDIAAQAYRRQTVQDLAEFTSDGVPVIVRIKNGTGTFSHFVVVDGVTVREGVAVVAIRDPHGLQYFSPVETFKKSFTGEVAVPKGPK
ncbi:cysteine peptidase family C39 domain-containing protein [Roseateles sp. UC29_93]|uniref:cysteine peptidase family C39 domain-containing protein n=1 Tax=Roseateles sp. UC29_93 TaxID=3350177 RepID=UPI003671D8F4